jgi:hypothetical protein
MEKLNRCSELTWGDNRVVHLFIQFSSRLECITSDWGSLELRSLVLWDQKVDFHFRFRLWHIYNLFVFDEKNCCDSVEHERNSEVQNFYDLVEFVLHG